ncbi:MAG: hypothetical protein HY700_21895 [Gemmatimonadetes bacterium]|nr:hypothetical protein [Gemmatimonadota bacterium]
MAKRQDEGLFVIDLRFWGRFALERNGGELRGRLTNALDRRTCAEELECDKGNEARVTRSANHWLLFPQMEKMNATRTTGKPSEVELRHEMMAVFHGE